MQTSPGFFMPRIPLDQIIHTRLGQQAFAVLARIVARVQMHQNLATLCYLLAWWWFSLVALKLRNSNYTMETTASSNVRRKIYVIVCLYMHSGVEVWYS